MALFRHFFRFEWRDGWRSGLPAVLLLVVTAATAAAVFSDRLGASYGNDPLLIEVLPALAAIPLNLVLAAVFFVAAGARDFSRRTDELVFSTPIRKSSYLGGRFAGVAAVAMVPAFGLSLGVLLAPHLPWGHRPFGPVNWEAHLAAWTIFTLPNLLIAGTVGFSAGVLTRNAFTALGGVLGLLAIAYLAPNVLLARVHDGAVAAALADPFGLATVRGVIFLRAAAPHQGVLVPFQGLLLWNRCLWLGLAAGLAVLTYRRFSFVRRTVPARRPAIESVPPPPAGRANAVAVAADSATWRWRQFIGSIRFDLRGLVREPLFVTVSVGLFVLGVAALWGQLSGRRVYWAAADPITAQVIVQVEDKFVPLFFVLLLVYAGHLVWSERDARVHEIHDALPLPNGLRYGAKLCVLGLVLGTSLALAALAGLAVQMILGFHRPELAFYLSRMVAWDFPLLLTFAVGAMTIQALAPGKYSGYLLSAILLVGNRVVWRALEIENGLVIFGYRPFVPPDPAAPRNWTAWFWFNLYWAWVSGLLALVAILFWPRGLETSYRSRWREAARRSTGGFRAATIILAAGLLATAAVVYYNIRVLNGWETKTEAAAVAAAYERDHGTDAGRPSPEATQVAYAIDLFPAMRRYTLRAEETIANRTDQPIDEVAFTLNRGYATTIDFPEAFLKSDDRRTGYSVYRLFAPMQPGESRTFTFRVEYAPRGFENDLTHLNVTPASTYLDWRIGPRLGYDRGRETKDPEVRRKAGLPERAEAGIAEVAEPLVALTADTVVSTARDQIAIASGVLEREWQEGDRHYFHYRMQGPIRFWAVTSAVYAVATAHAAGTALKVYYHPIDSSNVGPILAAAKDAAAYYTQHWGPYPGRELRLVEISPEENFSAATPGTLFLSENFGFTAKPAREGAFNPLRYLIAYELASQWWGHDFRQDRGETRWAIDALQQYAALKIASAGGQAGAALAWVSKTRASDLTSVSVSTRLGNWTALGGEGLFYLDSLIGEAPLDRALANARAALRSSARPDWGLNDFESELAAVVPADRRYVLSHLERDIRPLTVQLRAASAVGRSDGRFAVTVRLMADRFQTTDGHRRPYSVNNWVRLNGQSFHLQETWTTATFFAPTRPGTVTTEDEFDRQFAVDPTTFAQVRSISVPPLSQ